MRRALRVLAVAVLPACAGASVLSDLARDGTLSCRPALPFFCRNIHVGCAGRSRIATFDFTVTLDGKRARVQPASAGAETHTAPIEWAEDYAIVWLRPARDYLKITGEGTFSMRHYTRGTAYMSYGACR